MAVVTGARRQPAKRAEQVAENRRLLLDAAGRVFRELGYTRATLDAIAEAAGFTKGAVYSHFTSKADLFLTLLEERIARRREGMLATVQSSLADGDIEAMAVAVFSESRADPSWQLAVLEFRVTAARDPVVNARYAIAHQQTIDGVVGLLEELYRGSGLTPALSFRELALAGLMLDAGGFLEGLVADDSPADAARLFGRLARKET